MDRAVHVSDELLSAYLDGELPDHRAESVEEHLAACSPCRVRFDGMRRVVRSLARLERATPPPLLAQRVERRVVLLGSEPGLVERLEGRLRGLTLDSPMVVSFAVVLALAAIVYFFSHGVAGRRGDVSLQVATPEAASGLMGAVEAVEIDGRRLRRDGDAWIEEGGAGVGGTGVSGTGAGKAGVDNTGVGGTETGVETVPLASPRGAELLRLHPWIDDLLTLTGARRVRFVDDGGVVVELSADAAASQGDDRPAAEPEPPTAPTAAPPDPSP